METINYKLDSKLEKYRNKQSVAMSMMEYNKMIKMYNQLTEYAEQYSQDLGFFNRMIDYAKDIIALSVTFSQMIQMMYALNEFLNKYWYSYTIDDQVAMLRQHEEIRNAVVRLLDYIHDNTAMDDNLRTELINLYMTWRDAFSSIVTYDDLGLH